LINYAFEAIRTSYQHGDARALLAGQQMLHDDQLGDLLHPLLFWKMHALGEQPANKPLRGQWHRSHDFVHLGFAYWWAVLL
jgi:hypothetical protein